MRLRYTGAADGIFLRISSETMEPIHCVFLERQHRNVASVWMTSDFIFQFQDILIVEPFFMTFLLSLFMMFSCSKLYGEVLLLNIEENVSQFVFNNVEKYLFAEA